MRRIFTIIVLLLSIVSVNAIQGYSLKVEQSIIIAPDGKIIIRVDDLNDIPIDLEFIKKDNMSVKIDQKSVKVNNINKVDDMDNHYYIMVDSSGSMSEMIIANIKKELTEFSSQMKSGDNLTLIMFSDEIEVLFSGSSSQKEEINEAIESINNRGKITKLYDTITKYIDLVRSSKNEEMRNIALVISDGENYYSGGLTKEEVLNKFESEGFPVYAIIPNYNKDGIENLSQITRATKGISLVSNDEQLNNEFNEFSEQINSFYYIDVELDSNIVDNKSHEIEVTINSDSMNTSASSMFKYYGSKLEILKPDVSDYEISGQKITINYNKEIANIEEINGYKLSKNGSEIKVSNVQVVDKKTAILSFKEYLLPGEYKLEINNLKDITMEENVINKTIDINIPINYWLIGTLIAGLGIMTLLLITLIRKYKKYNYELAIIDKKGTRIVKNIKTRRPILVGRDSTANITLLDKNISKKHCEIKVRKKAIYLKDFNSLNGTIYKDIQIAEETKLKNGDIFEIAGYYIEVKVMNL